MKILLSPSKTMDIKKTKQLPETTILNQSTTDKIVGHIQTFSKQQLQKKMKVSDKLIDEVYQQYQTFDDQKEGQAIISYTGFVFKKLAIEEYTKADFTYLENHVYILDALYGLLKPSTLIKPYRLDFMMNLGINLYDQWSIDDDLDDSVLINLASNEYANMVTTKPMITISFLQRRESKYKNIATYTKQARGMFLNFMVKNNIKTIDQLTTFTEEDYHYNKDLSSQQELVFTR